MERVVAGDYSWGLSGALSWPSFRGFSLLLSCGSRPVRPFLGLLDVRFERLFVSALQVCAQTIEHVHIRHGIDIVFAKRDGLVEHRDAAIDLQAAIRVRTSEQPSDSINEYSDSASSFAFSAVISPFAIDQFATAAAYNNSGSAGFSAMALA